MWTSLVCAVLLRCLEEEDKRFYMRNLDSFKTAKAVVQDLKAKYFGDSQLAGGRILIKLVELKESNVDLIERHVNKRKSCKRKQGLQICRFSGKVFLFCFARFKSGEQGILFSQIELLINFMFRF